MQHTKQILLIAVFAAAASEVAAAEPKLESQQPKPEVLIKLINSSEFGPKALMKAAGLAQEIYAESGVATQWIDCTESDPRCAGSGPLSVYLRVLPRKQAKRLGLAKEALGVAIIPPADFGTIASAFSHRVREIEHWTGADPVVVLAHILAHEVGHLLLHQPEHSPKGLMQTAWKEKQLQNAKREKLRFTPRELEKLHQNVAARRATL